MNLLEKLSLSTGLKIESPFVYERFFPPPSKKYILIENNRREGLKPYASADELSAIIFPYLSQVDVEVIQFKINPTDIPIFRAKQLSKTPLQQLNNLIRYSELVITNNPYTCHVANQLSAKNIFLYQEDLYNLHIPKYNKTTNIISKGIDCFPELICREIIKHFNIQSELLRIEPIRKGLNYEDKRIECIPDFTLGEHPIAKQFLTIRADIHFSINNIMNLIANNSCILKCKRLPDIKYLLNPKISKNLHSIIFEVSSETTEEQLTELFSINKPVKLITNDAKNLKKIRLKHADYIIEFEDRKKNLDILKSICNNEVYYKSSKVIMSKGKQYSSESNWLENIPMSKSFEKIKPTQEFANELEEFKLFKLND
jgi:hypothetical protein